MEQPDGTFVAWAGLGETVGVDYVEDCPEHAQAAAMFALKRKSGHAECSPHYSRFEMRRTRCRLRSDVRECSTPFGDIDGFTPRDDPRADRADLHVVLNAFRRH